MSLLHKNRTGEAIEIIEKALSLRPEDVELPLFAAKIYASFGGSYLAKAATLLTEV